MDNDCSLRRDPKKERSKPPVNTGSQWITIALYGETSISDIGQTCGGNSQWITIALYGETGVTRTLPRRGIPSQWITIALYGET